MADVQTDMLLPAEMLERVFHLLPPREQVQVGQVSRRWRDLASHVRLTRARLPPNILRKVFQLLPPRDLKAVVQVCRWWREVGEAPALWAWVRLRVREKNIGYMGEVLRSRRLQAVRRMEVREMSKKLLQGVVRHPGLQEMVILYTNLSSVAHGEGLELLAQAVTRMEKVVLGYNPVTPEQVAAICTAITPNSRLKRLCLCNNLSSLRSVDATILAQGLTQLEEVELRGVQLATQQLEAVFAALDASSRLKILRIYRTDLSSVDPDVLARGINQLEVFNTGDMARKIPQRFRRR